MNKLLEIIKKIQENPEIADEMLREWDRLHDDPEVAEESAKLIEQKRHRRITATAQHEPRTSTQC